MNVDHQPSIRLLPEEKDNRRVRKPAYPRKVAFCKNTAKRNKPLFTKSFNFMVAQQHLFLIFGLIPVCRYFESHRAAGKVFLHSVYL